jgi:hypothetical protein
MNFKNDEEMNAMLHACIDGELTQQEEQNLYHWLETHPEAEARMKDYICIKNDISSLRFKEPTFENWENFETPPGTRLTRRWGLFLIFVPYTALIIWSLGESLKKGVNFENSMVIFILTGLILLFFSVLRQRVTESRRDRYSKRVEK